MFQVPLSIRHNVNEKAPRTTPRCTSSCVFGNHLYILFVCDDCVEILVVPLLAQESEKLLFVETTPLCAHVEQKDQDVLLTVVTENAYSVFFVNENLVLRDEVPHHFSCAEIAKKADVAVVKCANSFYMLEDSRFKLLKISPYFATVRDWYLTDKRFVVYLTCKHIHVYTLDAQFVLKEKQHGHFTFVASDNIICVDKSIIKISRVRDGALVSVCQIDINMEINAEWKCGEYIPKFNMIFLSGIVKDKHVVYVDGYLFHTQDLVTSFHLYRNCFFGLSQSTLYFLPNDPDFNLQFTKGEMECIENPQRAYTGRKYDLGETNCSARVGHVLACMVNTGVRVGIRKMVLNEIGRPDADRDRVTLLMDFLKFDYRAYQVWMDKKVDVEKIYCQISCIAGENEMTLKLLMKMQALSFTEVCSDLKEYHTEYLYLKGKHDLVRKGKYMESFMKCGRNVGKLLLARNLVSDVVYLFKENRLEDLDPKDYEKIRKLCFGEEKSKIWTNSQYHVTEEDIHRLLVFIYNRIGGDVKLLVQYCCGNYLFLEGLNGKYDRELENSVLGECMARDSFLKAGMDLFAKKRFALSLCKLKYRMFEKTGDKNALQGFRELIGEEVFVSGKKFVGKEMVEEHVQKDRNYGEVIRENIAKLRKLKSGCVWTDVAEARKWPAEFAGYTREMEKAERFYFSRCK